MNANPVIEFLGRRRSVSALGLQAPGPDPASLAHILAIAMRVPDHGKLAPWRFVVIDGPAKKRLVTKMEAIAATRHDARKAAVSLAKLERPPLCVAVVSRPQEAAIPEWEQVLSAGAACMNLVTAALAAGYGANWITEWYAYDASALALLDIREDERIAGFVMIGTTASAPDDRTRPTPADLITYLD
ncbi:MAG: nitroreductase [Novosphingobium sp.]